MSKTDTPVMNFVAELLSGGSPLDAAMSAGRGFEAALARTASPSERDMARLNKLRAADALRKRTRRKMSGGRDEGGDISSSSRVFNVPQIVKEGRKSPASGGRPVDSPKPPAVVDDWPPDYRDLFWSAYPAGRKTEKKAVFAKLDRVRKAGEVAFVKLMDGLARYRAVAEPRFTKAPLVWLNRGCWDDEHGARHLPPAKPRTFFDIANGEHNGQ